MVTEVLNNSRLKARFSGTVPPPMYGHTATAHGDEIIVIGGESNVFQLPVQFAIRASMSTNH